MKIGTLSSPALSPVDPLEDLDVATNLGMMAYHFNFMKYKRTSLSSLDHYLSI